MKVEPIQIIYGVRFTTLLFPLNYSGLMNSLEKRGYEISSGIPFPRLPIRIGGAGEIARKGKTIVQVDAGQQILQVVGTDLKSTFECFQEIEKALKEDCNFQIIDFARTYNISANYVSSTRNRSYEAIAKAFSSPIFNDLGKIMEENLWPLTLNFAGANLVVNSNNWFDISIRPNLERDNSYTIEVVFRNADRLKTEKFLQTLEEKLTRIIELIDR